jgi:hypothetical protein
MVALPAPARSATASMLIEFRPWSGSGSALARGLVSGARPRSGDLSLQPFLIPDGNTALPYGPVYVRFRDERPSQRVGDHAGADAAMLAYTARAWTVLIRLRSQLCARLSVPRR